MSNAKMMEPFQIKSNSSSSNSMGRSKKSVVPPPLSLPNLNTQTDDEKITKSNQIQQQKEVTNKCCLSSSSSKDCPHQSVPYVLPIVQRSQILQTLMASSSRLLVPPSYETKHRKSHTTLNANQIILLRQRQILNQDTVADPEWLNFMRLIVYKPLENEIKMLLDKYKTTYYDRLYAPNTSDATIRASLCDIVSETLGAYSATSTLPIVLNNVPTNVLPTSIPNHIDIKNNSKRKRNNNNNNVSQPSDRVINNRTKFVISHVIPGNCDNLTNSNKMIYQQRYKQFQKKYSRLFTYIPDKEEQEYLIRKGHYKYIAPSSTRSSNNQNNNNICLMLYNEVFSSMDDYDIEFSGISIDNSFTLSEQFLARIHSSIQ